MNVLSIKHLLPEVAELGLGVTGVEAIEKYVLLKSFLIEHQFLLGSGCSYRLQVAVSNIPNMEVPQCLEDLDDEELGAALVQSACCLEKRTTGVSDPGLRSRISLTWLNIISSMSPFIFSMTTKILS